MQICTFNQLSLNDLYKLLQLRARVFVQEQQSIYDEVDDLDLSAIHLLKWQGNDLIAYARLLPPSTNTSNTIIGRVVVAKSARNQGLGKAIFAAAFEQAQMLYPQHLVKLSAQTSIKGLYLSFGFIEQGDAYDDGGVEHIDMIWKKS